MSTCSPTTTPCIVSRLPDKYEGLAEGQLVADIDWFRFGYKGYEVIYRPTEKSNWFVPVPEVWV